MKARIARSLSKAEIKAMMPEIRQQCIEQTEQYEAELDVVTLYTLSKIFGFGKKRLDRFYNEMFRLRDEMKERYRLGDDDSMGDYAMYVKLKEKGIDVKQMYDSQTESHRFKVKVT
jgi:predicted subunit of tRNA(5-methylaminomethyl-2-thiouridylate) methyltransferase